MTWKSGMNVKKKKENRPTDVVTIVAMRARMTMTLLDP